MKLWVTLPLLLAAGCASTDLSVKKADAFPTALSGSYRVAVVPFAVSAEADSAITASLADLGNLLSLETGARSETAHERAGLVMRRAFVASLAGGPLQVAELWVTDTTLHHHGIHAAEWSDPANAERLAAMLDVDGIVLGEVTDWNRSYVVAQTTQTVGLRVRLYDRRSGDLWFESVRRESSGSGITGGPTGFVSAATEPIAGLRDSVLEELARSVARNSATDLAGSGTAADVALANARGSAPSLAFVSVAVAHDGPLMPGDKLTVVALGTAGSDVRFDIGRYRTGVPMVEVARHAHPRGERATYVGTWVVQPGERVRGAPVRVTIRSPDGGAPLRTVHRVPKQRIDIG